ncbi:hypothetical protein [Nereida sp. MMG025]|uniref:hypothetical protein n=1 Tax=Nereida sp. MMG025 TaxID=2909981 RepID=UPI001F4873A8|nr:hypothetical protein [Nereida sp. MMG025]MCF6445702.1 hypothetical protein [Nereida sp. MMG025]
MVGNLSRPWGRSNVSPHDWISILDFELERKGRQSSLAEKQQWLAAHGYYTENTAISKLRAVHECDRILSAKQEAIIETIIQNVSVRTCIQYFENLTYRSFKFFNPSGNPQKHTDYSSLPLGVYQGTRYSFSSPGRLIRSAFLFYQNPRNHEHVAGYADSIAVGRESEISNVLRFKEVRLIKDRSKEQYQLLIGGFVLYNHGCFYLIGVSIETPPAVTEKRIEMSDIRHMQMVYYILDDDDDANVVRGLKVTGLRYQRDPAAAVLHLERRTDSKLNVTNWEQVYKEPGLEIGMIDVRTKSSVVRPDLLKYKELLNPSPDESYQMVSVGRWFD